MEAVRILYLDNGVDISCLSRKNDDLVDVRVTRLETEEVFHGESYVVSQRGKELARSATKEKYELVVIAHNEGIGFAYAEILPPEMRNRALIVDWDNLLSGDRGLYEMLGYSHFAADERVIIQLEEMLWLLDQGW